MVKPLAAPLQRNFGDMPSQNKTNNKSSIPDLYQDNIKKDLTESDDRNVGVNADFFHISLYQR